MQEEGLKQRLSKLGHLPGGVVQAELNKTIARIRRLDMRGRDNLTIKIIVLNLLDSKEEKK